MRRRCRFEGVRVMNGTAALVSDLGTRTRMSTIAKALVHSQELPTTGTKSDFFNRISMKADISGFKKSHYAARRQ